MSEQEVLQFIYTKLSEQFKIQRMVLFGSRARGEAKADSDYDVLVVAESDIPFVKRQGLARIALGPRDFPLDLLVYTPAEAEAEAAILGSTVFFAQREGREYHAAS
jgi:uncharacterized protein